jgi:predicted Rossmann fold flavoprotein
MNSLWDVAIIGGGPAGLMAAIRAAERGRKTILLDKNREPGVKILLSGGTRCNLTHATDAQGIVRAFGKNGRFLHSALARLGPQQVIDLFEAEGVPTKVENGGKVFPVSDWAADVRDALVRRLKQTGVTFAPSEPLTDLIRTDTGFQLGTPGRSLVAENIILATGGQSYPACGTTGDGYRLAAALGHRIVPPRTALVPVTSHAPWVLALQGVTLPDVAINVVDRQGDDTVEHGCNKRKPLAVGRGALLFTHFGISGPVVLDISHVVSGAAQPNAITLDCDLLPQTSAAELEDVLARQCGQFGKRCAAVLLDTWLPHRVGEMLIVLAGVPPDRPLGEVSNADRRRVAGMAKRLAIPASGTMGFRKAELTAGGVSLEEIDSRTMQSRILPHLYVIGELLDLQGPVGGYNFQSAFSTGWLAGESV